MSRYEGVCLISSEARIYHKVNHWMWNSEVVELSKAVTRCGVKFGGLWAIYSIDRKRADLLARPCKHCFPEGGR